MSTTLIGFVCSPTEWAYLAALKGAGTLVGTADPFHGLLADEVEEALRSARRSLLERGVIRMQPDGLLQVDAAFDPLLQVAVAPERTAILTLQEAGQELLRRYFYIAGDAAVEQSTGERIELAGPMPLAQVVTRIESRLHLDRFTLMLESVAGACYLSEAAWSDAQDATQQGGVAAALPVLAAAGLPADTAQSLATAIAQPVTSGSLLLVTPSQADWEVAGLAYLAGGNGLWLIRRAQRGAQVEIEVTPATGSDLAQALRRMLEQGFVTA